jgi:hypothetical protein
MKNHGVKSWLVVSLLMICTMITASAFGQSQKGTFSILIENDKFTGTDRHYTNGILLSYLSGKDDVPDWLHPATKWLPGISEEAALRTGYVFGQSIFTPDDTDTREFIPDQRPYAGWLYGGIALIAETEDRLDTWELDLGIVGPSAQAEEVQNGFHQLIGVNEAKGWANQIDDEFGYAFVYERKWRNLWEYRLTGYGVDIIPHMGGSIGNVGTFLNVGATLRLGNDLTNDFGAPRIRPSLPGSNFFLPKDEFGWYLFAGVDGRAVAYNIFLDKNPPTGELEIDKNTFVGDLQAGLVMNILGTRLAYSYVYRTKEYDQQDEPDHFGSISLSLNF